MNTATARRASGELSKATTFGQQVVQGIIIGLAAVAGGCASAPAEIPTGRWTGTGACVATDCSEHQQELRNLDYKAEVTSTRTKVDGRDAVVLEIYSDHQDPAFFDGKDVSFIVLLFKAATPTAAGSRYEVHAKLELCKSPGDRQAVTEAKLAEILKEETLPGAWATSTGNTFMLFIPYSFDKDGKGPTFAESFSFESGRLVKTGHFCEGSRKMIVWVEELHRH